MREGIKIVARMLSSTRITVNRIAVPPSRVAEIFFRRTVVQLSREPESLPVFLAPPGFQMPATFGRFL